MSCAPHLDQKLLVAVRFVTHAEHLSWLFAAVVAHGRGAVTLTGVDTPAVVAPAAAATAAASTAVLWSPEQQLSCLDACLGCIQDAGCGKVGDPYAAAAAAVSLRADVVCFNLFALEGLIVADAAGLPFVALHPYPPPPQQPPQQPLQPPPPPPPSKPEHRKCGGGGPGAHRRWLRALLAEDWPHLLGQLDLAAAAAPHVSALTFEDFAHWVGGGPGRGFAGL